MEAAAEFCENEIGFDDNNEACEAVMPPDLDTDSDRLAEAANITAAQAKAAIVWMRERFEQDIQHAAGDALSRLLAAIIPPEGRISPHIVGMRVLSVSFLLDLPSKKRGGAFLLIGFMALGGFVVQRGFIAEG